MEQDYKEQLRMMTEGLGEWMDRRERRRRGWRIAGGAAMVALLVMLQVFFPWRRKEVVVQKEVYYISENGEVSTTRPAATPGADTSLTVQPQHKNNPTGRKLQATASRTGDTVWQHINWEGDDGEKATIQIGSNGLLINSEDNGEKATVEIGASGLRINSEDRSGHQEKFNITIDGTGVHLNTSECKAMAAKKRAEGKAAAARKRLEDKRKAAEKRTAERALAKEKRAIERASAKERAKDSIRITIIDSNDMHQNIDED